MLKVIVELHPFGDEKEKKEIAHLFIGNAGRGHGENTADYHVWKEDPRPHLEKTKERPPLDGIVLEYDRSQGPLTLLLRALESLELGV